jgi:endonuclease G, mitochondrial
MCLFGKSPDSGPQRVMASFRSQRQLVIQFLLLVVLWWLAVPVFGRDRVVVLDRDNVVIKTPILESYFYRPIKQPLFVKYSLHKGGGASDRAGMRFINDRPEIETATDRDYAGSGYDKGHLANAEDFAFNRRKQELTFVYYNALPQTGNLNRGVWKTYETTVRQWSKKDRLVIICGGYRFRKKGRLYVPTHCFKVVQNEKTKEVLFCGTFTNTSKATKREVTSSSLERTLGYPLPMLRPVGKRVDGERVARR